MSKSWLSILLTGLVFLPFTVQAETIVQDNSTATNLGLYGGEVRDVASDPASDYVYVTTYSPNGLFVSANNGASWHGLDTSVYDLGEPRGVELDQFGNVYLLISEGLFKSTDHGTTFTEIGSIDGYGNNFIYHNGTLLVGRNDGAVSISTDLGATFTTTSVIQANSYVLSLAASPTTDTYYATLDDTHNATLYVTTNRGATWAEANTDDIANRYTTINVDPNNANHLIMLSYGEDIDPWQSYDSGATWNQFDVGAGTVGTMTTDSTGRLYLGSAYSDDSGHTWSAVNTTTPANRVSSVWPDSSDTNRLYGSTFGAVAISTDRGTSWIDSNTGITAVTVRDVSQSVDKNTVWIATNAGLAHTANFTDASPTWEFPLHYDYYPNVVWVSPVDSNTVVVGGYQALYRTTDAGTTWSTIANWNSDYAVKSVVANPVDPAIVYAIGGIQNTVDAITGVVMMSTDSGATWADLTIADNAAGQTAAVAVDGSLYIGAGALDINGTTATGVYKYDGASWMHLPDSPAEQITSLVADPSDANVLYATASDFNSYKHSDGGVYKTTNAGATWAKLSTISGNGLDQASKYRVITIQGSTHTLYMAGTGIDTSAGTIWKSADAGATWGIYYVGLENETFNTLLFDGLIAGNSRGAYDIRGQVHFTNQVANNHIYSTIKDATTHKKITRKKITLWQKKHGKWVKIDHHKTNKKGQVVFFIHPTKSTRYQLRYSPTGKAAEEYSTSRSEVMKILL